MILRLLLLSAVLVPGTGCLAPQGGGLSYTRGAATFGLRVDMDGTRLSAGLADGKQMLGGDILFGQRERRAENGPDTAQVFDAAGRPNFGRPRPRTVEGFAK